MPSTEGDTGSCDGWSVRESEERLCSENISDMVETLREMRRHLCTYEMPETVG